MSHLSTSVIQGKVKPVNSPGSTMRAVSVTKLGEELLLDQSRDKHQMSKNHVFISLTHAHTHTHTKRKAYTNRP